MDNDRNTTEKAARRFSLRWQLAIGMASGFFVDAINLETSHVN